MAMDRSKWEYKPFEDCIEKSKKTKQLMTSDYQPEGTYPIISQEASLISGYTDAPDYVNHFDRPIVIFGDHTRVLKYVDFDFAVGADGVKILIPHTNLDAKFLLCFLTWYKIPNLGYSRHYKLLKEISVPVPPMEDQQRIVAELDCLNEMIALKQEQLKEFDKLAQSIFYAMFGDPVSNEKGWEVIKLGDISSCITKGTTPTTLGFSFVEEGINFVKVESFVDGKIDYSKLAHITHECNLALSRSQLESEDLLVCIAGATIGKMAVVDTSILPANTNQACAIVRLKDKKNLCFIHFSLALKLMNDIIQMGKGVAQPNLSLGQLRNFVISFPPLELQQQFADKISAIEAQKELVKQSIAETQSLFDSRMDYYFN